MASRKPISFHSVNKTCLLLQALNMLLMNAIFIYFSQITDSNLNNSLKTSNFFV